MEEKERYELFGEFGIIHDTSPNAECMLLNKFQTCEILNRQDKENQQLKQQLEELKGKRLEFYNDDVRQTQVINGVHFDIEQLLVFSEYVEHEKNISADKDKQINQLKQQLHDLPKKIMEEIRDVAGDYWDFNMCEECGNVPDLNTLTMEDFDEILDTILKKYGEEDESNND